MFVSLKSWFLYEEKLVSEQSISVHYFFTSIYQYYIGLDFAKFQTPIDHKFIRTKKKVDKKIAIALNFTKEIL